MAARRKLTKKPATGGAATAASKHAEGVRERNQKLDAVTVSVIKDSASSVHQKILKTGKPELSFPIRSLQNVSYSQQRGYFEIGRQRKTRTLTVNTVKSFAQTLRMMGLSKQLVETNDFATKRDAYYQSKNWDEARFDEQTESDAVMDDIEAMCSVRGADRKSVV